MPCRPRPLLAHLYIIPPNKNPPLIRTPPNRNLCTPEAHRHLGRLPAHVPGPAPPGPDSNNDNNTNNDNNHYYDTTTTTTTNNNNNNDNN